MLCALQTAVGRWWCVYAHQGVVPIVNENDAVSANKGYTPSTVFSDNDSLAALVAKEANADVRIMTTMMMMVHECSCRDGHDGDDAHGGHGGHDDHVRARHCPATRRITD